MYIHHCGRRVPPHCPPTLASSCWILFRYSCSLVDHSCSCTLILSTWCPTSLLCILRSSLILEEIEQYKNETISHIHTYVRTYLRTYPLLKLEERTVEIKQARYVHEQEFISLLIICMYILSIWISPKMTAQTKLKRNKESWLLDKVPHNAGHWQTTKLYTHSRKHLSSLLKMLPVLFTNGCLQLMYPGV